jgi:hypothetical protein
MKNGESTVISQIGLRRPRDRVKTKKLGSDISRNVELEFMYVAMCEELKKFDSDLIR